MYGSSPVEQPAHQMRIRRSPRASSDGRTSSASARICGGMRAKYVSPIVSPSIRVCSSLGVGPDPVQVVGRPRQAESLAAGGDQVHQHLVPRRIHHQTAGVGAPRRRSRGPRLRRSSAGHRSDRSGRATRPTSARRSRASGRISIDDAGRDGRTRHAVDGRGVLVLGDGGGAGGVQRGHTVRAVASHPGEQDADGPPTEYGGDARRRPGRRTARGGPADAGAAAQPSCVRPGGRVRPANPDLPGRRGPRLAVADRRRRRARPAAGSCC